MTRLIENLDVEHLSFIYEVALSEWGRRKPIYEIHKWWARRYSNVIRAALIAYLLDANVDINDFRRAFQHLGKELKYEASRTWIFDPFIGGGTIVTEACMLGFNVVGIDINPVATFITRSQLSLIRNIVTEKVFLNRAKDIIKRAWNKVKHLWLFPSNGMKLYTFAAISKEGICRVNPYLGKHGKKLWFICPNCRNVFTCEDNSQNLYSCPECRTKVKATTRVKEQPSLLEFKCADTVEIGYNMFAYAVEVYKGTERVFLSVFDLNIRQKLKNQVNHAKLLIKKLSKQYQDIMYIEIPQGIETLRVKKLGYDDFSKLFSYCQLATYLVLAEEIRRVPDREIKELLTLALSDSARSCSTLASYYQPYAKVNPAFVIKSFWLPKNPVELNVLAHSPKDPLHPIGRGNFISALRKILRAFKWVKNPKIKVRKNAVRNELHLTIKPIGKVYIFNLAVQELQSLNTSFIPKNFDLIITDPPYIDTQYYSELSLIFMYVQNLVLQRYNAKNFVSQYQRIKDLEIAPSRLSKSKYESYAKCMSMIFRKLKSLLKDYGYLIFTFHYPKTKGWYALYKSIASAGFIPANFYVIPGEASGKLGRSSVLTDILLVFKKNNDEKIFKEEDLTMSLQLMPYLLRNNNVRKFFGEGYKLKSALLNAACAYTLMRNVRNNISFKEFKKEVKTIMSTLEQAI